jgi:hypothetical protein
VAYNYLDEKNLKDTLHDSEQYVKPFLQGLNELERITEGKPGKVPKGKPRVTDGTLAGYKRETPKQVIQQIPTGKVVIRSLRDQEEQVSAILTDILLPNANAGGTPYDKAKLAIEECYPFGSAWFHVYYDRTGDLLHANYRLINVKNVLFPKGKVSEFDLPYVGIVDYMTEDDIKYEMWRCTYLRKQAESRGETYDGKHDMKAWQLLLDSGAQEKDDEHKTEAEKKHGQNDGFYKTIKWMQRGAGATFYRHAPSIDKVLYTEVTKDPRGVIPLHGLVPAPSRSNPFGRPLAAISAGKQNLLDFRMQMEQYREGMGLSPTLKKWGHTPMSKVKLVPDHIIEMQGTKATDDVEVLDVTSNANRNYANDSSYIKTQIYNEQGGTNDSSISAEAGATGFSKTSSGVKQQEARTSISKDDLRRLSEQTHQRVFETLINIHMAESQGTKSLELQDETMKRLKLSEDPVMNYDQDFGKIRWSVDAGTAQAADNERENEKLSALLEVKMKYGGQPDKKYMLLFNQIVKNAGVDDPEKIMYTDDELAFAQQQDDMNRQMAMQQMELQQIQAEQAKQQALNPQVVQPTVGEPPLPPEALQPNQSDPSVEEDRALAQQQLLEAGATPEQAEQLLQHIDQGNL